MTPEQRNALERELGTLDRTIDAGSGTPNTYYNRGKTLIELGYYDDAIDDFNEAITSFSCAGYYVERGNAYRHRGRLDDNPDDYEKAIEDFKKAAAFDPRRTISSGRYAKRISDLYRSKGLACIGDSDDPALHEQAIKDFNNAVWFNRNRPYNYYRRGRSRIQLVQYEEAVKDFKEVISRQPEYWWAYYYMGYAYNGLGMYGEAVESFETAEPRLGWTTNKLKRHKGYALNGLGDYERAIENLNQFIKHTANDCYAYCYIGEAYNNTGQNRLAMDNFNKAIKCSLDKKDKAFTHFYRGLGWRDQERNKQAIMDITKAIEFKPDHASFYIHRGNIHSLMGECDKAFEDYDDAVRCCYDSYVTEILTEKHIRWMKDLEKSYAQLNRLRDACDRNSAMYYYYGGVGELLRGSPPRRILQYFNKAKCLGYHDPTKVTQHLERLMERIVTL